MDIIIPHFNANVYRERNLIFIINNYLRHLPECDIIVVEQNGKTELGDLKDMVTHIRVDYEGDDFRKSSLINEGVRHSSDEIIILSDNDCVLPISVIGKLEGYMKSCDYFVPFSDINFLNEGHTRQVIKTGRFVQSKKKFNLHVNRYTGGVILFKRSLFDKVGGFEESIVGWGKEDDVFHAKCKRIGASIRRIPEESILLHVFHPTLISKKYIESTRYIQNSKILALFKRMSDEDFNRYLRDKYKVDNQLDKLLKKYSDKKMLETRIWITCGEGFVFFDSSAYDLIVDESGVFGLEQVFTSIMKEDEPATVNKVISEIYQRCGVLKPEETAVVDKYKAITGYDSQ